MTKQELSALPKGTTLFALSRKVSRSGIREVFDVFFISGCERNETIDTAVRYLEHPDVQAIPFALPVSNIARALKGMCSSGARLYWIRIAPEDAKEFHKRAECHASTSINQDNRVGGAFYVNGCGFDRAAAVIQSLSQWATGDPHYFRSERV